MMRELLLISWACSHPYWVNDGVIEGVMRLYEDFLDSDCLASMTGYATT